MKFKYGAFVSYAWDDNTDPVTDHGAGAVTKGWVEKFRNMLSDCLSNELGPTEVFRDKHGLRHDQDISNQLSDRLRESATLVIIASPSYLKSKWCGEELRVFREHCQTRGQKGGIFVCELKPLQEEDLPNALRGLLRFQLFTSTEKEAPRGRLEFEFEDHKRQIWDCCVNLSYQISSLVRAASQNSSVENQVTQEDPLNVFLADVTDDLAYERQELRDHLNRLGYRVFPDVEEFFDSSSEESEQRLDECLEKSDAFVQLLSGASGRVLRRINTTYPEFQYQKAMESSLSIHQWRSDEIKHGAKLKNVVSPTYQELLFGSDVIAMNFEAYKSSLERSLTSVRTSSVSDQPGVVVRYDEAHHNEIANLQKTLNQQGLRTQLFRFNETIGNLLQKSCGMLTYCKDESPSVRDAIWEMQELCFGSSTSVLPCLYMVPPPEERVPPASFEGMLATTSLDDFITALKKQKPR